MLPLATSRAGKIQQILSVYALAEDPPPQNHRKNQHSPVPALHSTMLATLIRPRAVGYFVTQWESHLPVQDLSFQTRMIEPVASCLLPRQVVTCKAGPIKPGRGSHGASLSSSY
jgi:hypothetical protein